MEASTSQNSSSSNVGCLIVVKSADEVNDNDAAAEEDPPSIEEIKLNHPLEIFQTDAGSEEEDEEEDDDDDNEAPNFMSAFVDNINTCRRESQFQRSTANNSNTLREKGMLRPANVARRNSFRATICDVISAARFVDRKGPDDVKDQDGGVPDVEVSQEAGGGDEDEDEDEEDDDEEEEEEDEEDQTKQALHLKNVANYVESFICNITGDVEMSHEYLNKVAIPPKTLSTTATSKTNTSVSIGNANIGSVTNNMNNNIIIVKQAPNDDDDPCSSKTLESSPPSSGDKAAANLANATTINYVFNFFKRKKSKTSKKVTEESQVEGGTSLLAPKTAEMPGHNPRRKSGWTTVKVGRAFNFWGRRKTPKGVTFGGSDDEDDAEPGSSEENKGTGKRWSGAVTRLTDTIFLLRSKNARQEARKARRRSLKKVTQGVIKSNAVDKAKDRLEKQKEAPKAVQRTRSVDDDDDEDRGCCNDEECLCRIS